MANMNERHGCLTAWLIFTIVINYLTALFFLRCEEYLPQLPMQMPIVLAGLCVFNVMCVVALFRWKKWGFYGIAASGIIAVVINLSLGIHPARALVGLLGVVILYVVLHLGNENKGWTQLK